MNNALGIYLVTDMAHHRQRIFTPVINSISSERPGSLKSKDDLGLSASSRKIHLLYYIVPKKWNYIMLKMVSNETDIDSNKIEFDITFRMRFCGNYFMWASSDRYLWLCKLARSARMLCCVGSSGIIHPVEQQVQHCNIGSSLPTLATPSTSTTANTQPQDAQHTPDEEGQWEECQKCHEEGKCAENFQNRWQIPRQPRADCKYFHITDYRQIHSHRSYVIL